MFSHWLPIRWKHGMNPNLCKSSDVFSKKQTGAAKVDVSRSKKKERKAIFLQSSCPSASKHSHNSPARQNCCFDPLQGRLHLLTPRWERASRGELEERASSTATLTEGSGERSWQGKMFSLLWWLCFVASLWMCLVKVVSVSSRLKSKFCSWERVRERESACTSGACFQHQYNRNTLPSNS